MSLDSLCLQRDPTLCCSPCHSSSFSLSPSRVSMGFQSLSFGMSHLAIQHSVAPRFSICSFPAPLQQQEVRPHPTSCNKLPSPTRSPKIPSQSPHGDFSSATTSLECPDVPSPSQLLTAFWTERQSKPSSPHQTPNLLLGWSPPPTWCRAGGHEGLLVWRGCSQNFCKHHFYCLFPT